MKQLFVGLVIATLTCMWMAPVIAQTPPAMQTNGCGSGRFGFLVPNSTEFTMCQFKGSCDKHDTCYARCDKGGDLFGSPLCKDEPSRKERRKVCDAALQTNIITANNDRSPCRVYASIYRVAVQIMGNSFFNGIAGPKPAGSNQIKNLLAYLEANPQAFDPAELDAAFANLADGGIEGTNYEFWLYKDGPSPPMLVARQGNRELFKVDGTRSAE
jgi:hypothetical protein